METPPDAEFDPAPTTSEAESGGGVGAWTLVWALVAMKLLTIAIVVVAARRAADRPLFAVMTQHWSF